MGTDAPLRQPIPLARSILWIPASAAGQGGAGQPGHIAFPVFLAQSVLQAIHEHLAAPPKAGQGMIGFLVGDLCECPETNVSYLIIDSALRLNQPIYGDRTMDVVTRLWDRIEAQATEQHGYLIGWYHTHPPHPIALSEHDLETHEHYFAEPWQIALIVGTGADGTEPAAGLFRASSDESWPTTQLPFYELLGEESLRAGAKRRSLITWKNYRAHDPLADRTGRAVPKAVPKGEPPEAAAPAPPHLEPTAEPPQPRPTTAPAAPPQRSAPAKSDELVFLTTAQDFASPPPPAPARTPRREPPPGPVRPAAPPAPATPSAPRATPPPRSPTAEEPVEARDEEPVREPLRQPVEESSAEPVEAWREKAVAEQRPRPVRAPPARRRRRKRRRGVWVAVFGILLVGAGAGVYLQFRPSLPTLPKLPKLPSLPWPKRQATAPPAAARPQATASPRRPATPLGRLDRVGDSLAQAVRSFGGRAALFDRRELACDGLARGLRAVEDRWLAYTAARRASGVLDPQHAVRDQRLYAGVDSVERRFDQSGCPRP